MNIFEKNICIDFNSTIMTLSFDTFLSIIFDNIKTDICYYDSIEELEDKLKTIQELNLINDENKSYICINFNDAKNKDLFVMFATGLLHRANSLCDYALNQ